MLAVTSLLENFGFEEGNTWDLEAKEKRGLKTLSETESQFIVPYNILSYSFTDSNRKYTLQVPVTFLPNKHDVAETGTRLTKWKTIFSSNTYMRTTAVTMKHAANHTLPET